MQVINNNPKNIKRQEAYKSVNGEILHFTLRTISGEIRLAANSIDGTLHVIDANGSVVKFS